MFCDKAQIKIKAGDGGAGHVSFLHEKYREFGGPDGGDGGRGGDIIFRVDNNLNTLYYFKTHHEIKAENGERGKKRKCHGKKGENRIIGVPRGTVIIDEDSKKIIGDLSEEAEITVAQGGSGGFGNAHFTSSTRQAPRVSELGEPGEEKKLTLELKLIADVGLVGLPNVGKSTLLSVVTSARPKIADYEFTTLVPNLGVVEPGTFGAARGFIIADIPGLIEGASKGKGLGDEFLRHIERTKVLVHLIDSTHANLQVDYKTIKEELKHYKINLSNRPQIVVLTKIDSISPEVLSSKLTEISKAVRGSKVFAISAVAHKGLPELLHEVEAMLSMTVKNEMSNEKKGDYKIFTMDDVVGKNLFEVIKKRNHFVVTGKKIEKFAVQTDFENLYAVGRFRDILKKMGIEKELTRAGAVRGCKVKIAGKEFEF